MTKSIFFIFVYLIVLLVAGCKRKDRLDNIKRIAINKNAIFFSECVITNEQKIDTMYYLTINFSESPNLYIKVDTQYNYYIKGKLFIDTTKSLREFKVRLQFIDKLTNTNYSDGEYIVCLDNNNEFLYNDLIDDNRINLFLSMIKKKAKKDNLSYCAISSTQDSIAVFSK